MCVCARVVMVVGESMQVLGFCPEEKVDKMDTSNIPYQSSLPLSVTPSIHFIIIIIIIIARR